MDLLLLLWNPDPVTRSCGTGGSLQRWRRESAGTSDASQSVDDALIHEGESEDVKIERPATSG